MLRSFLLAVPLFLSAALAPAAQGATVYTLATNLFSGDAYTVTSFTFDEGTGTGTILKTFDSSSDDIFLAVALGTHLDWMTITQFDDHPGNPTEVNFFQFANVMFTSFAGNPDETIGFEATLAPEPSTVSLLLLGGAALAVRARRRLRR